MKEFFQWIADFFSNLFKAKDPGVWPLPEVGDKHPQEIERLSAANYFGSPQVKWLLAHFKWSEHNKEQNAILSKYWKISGLPSYKSILGSVHAWCEMIQNGADVESGFKGSGRADAISSASWGDECPAWFGSRLHMRHPSGGNHATRFLFWYDKEKKWAACAGGNQGDELNITIYDGKSEKFSKFRWAKGQPPGREVTREEFEKAFPQFTKYKFSGSTR